MSKRKLLKSVPHVSRSFFSEQNRDLLGAQEKEQYYTCEQSREDELS